MNRLALPELTESVETMRNPDKIRLKVLAWNYKLA